MQYCNITCAYPRTEHIPNSINGARQNLVQPEGVPFNLDLPWTPPLSSEPSNHGIKNVLGSNGEKPSH
jgi:hypothetical protein